MPRPLWIALSGVYLAGLGIFAKVVANFPWEVTVSAWVQSRPTPWLDAVMEAVSLPGVLVLAAPMVALTAVVLYIKGWRGEAVLIVATTVAGRLITLVVKELVGRPRPTDDVVRVLQEASSNSFPSGHVMHAMVFLGALAVILAIQPRPGATLRTAQVVLALLATGASRIYLGAHWLGDVVGGYAIGSAVVAASVWVWRRSARGRSQE